MTEQFREPISVAGPTGATAVSRYVGATTSGAPSSGTFSTGDFVIDQSGKVWVCTAGGTSGTWGSVGAPIAPTINAQTGTTYTTVLGDASNWVTLNNASAITVSIPTNASVAYPIGSVIFFVGIGAGQVTINAVTSGTTTIESTGATSTAPKLRAKYSSASALKLATDTWLVLGDIS